MEKLVERIKIVFARIVDVYETIENPLQAEYVLGELEGIKFFRDTIKTNTLNMSRAIALEKMCELSLSAVRSRGFFVGCAIAMALSHDIETTA